MEPTHTQEFRIRDLSTRSVTLFPTRAQVVREIKDVALKPGINEITVVGLTPTVDEHSIKVEGSGSAIITDITVELLPNRDIFQDIYPDSDSDSDPDIAEEEEDDDVQEVSSAKLEVREKLALLDDEQHRLKEVIASAESRLKMLDAYGSSITSPETKWDVAIEAGIETYRTERAMVFQDHMDSTVRSRQLLKEITALKKEQARLNSLEAKEKAKAAKAKAKIQKAKDKLKEQEARRRAERIKEKNRIRRERENFWPRFSYSVRITLDAASFTPTSSRRSSIASASDVVHAVSEKAIASSSEDAAGITCDLSLSYVTSSAFWSPSYDLALSTTTNTAVLCFDAQLTNMTSETWSNCRLTLSTSQTTFSGLQDAIPTLVPWRVKLAGKGVGRSDSGIMDSQEERAQKGSWHAQQNEWQSQKPRAQLFGVTTFQFGQFPDPPVPSPFQPAVPAMAYKSVAGPIVAASAPRPGGGGLFGSSTNANTITSAFGAPGNTGVTTGFGIMQQQQQQQQSSGLFGGAPQSEAFHQQQALAQSVVHKKSGEARRGLFRQDGNPDPSDEDDGATILEPTPELSFQESTFEETGLTATYDVPNLKTLKPSSTASKQRVARIQFVNVYFSRTVVAKYKPVAYLKAKLRNTSKLTLLRGPTGLTLDGTFMGRSTLPRCSAGDSFFMSLGVDPAIKVVYPKPEVKRSTTGVFTKGDNSLYTRTITLVNTRATAGKPVDIMVLDQVPVSEDEKLRVELVQPRGLSTVGASVAAGLPGKEGKDEKEWGKATATLKKAGEVAWDVKLNAGRTVKLVLEYDVALPTGDQVIQC
ncbi:hypothetical protein B0T19DRAFT_486664 [Cercophora scortea]|uniref:Mucoidy inhibitor-like protein n=1 Tax=Cercophora scortea TaxID=314031 RepID=A0AAE0IGW9_9PEZI|nr:hypothetical protein B0T19DRAFT_486664 [Cercophora scortea]